MCSRGNTRGGLLPIPSLMELQPREKNGSGEVIQQEISVRETRLMPISERYYWKERMFFFISNMF
jgi:hypothetical protein